MTLAEESRRYNPRPFPALSCYAGTGHDGARRSGTRLDLVQTRVLAVRAYSGLEVRGNCYRCGIALIKP